MADLTYEILTDREQYADDQTITLANGKTTTVKAMRDAYLPKADFTRETEKWAGERRTLQGTLEERQRQADALSQQLADALRAKDAPAEVPPQGSFTEAQLLADPVVGPILKRQQDATARLEAAEARMAAHEKYVMTREYQGRLNAVEAKYNARFNKDGKKPFKMPEFLEYVQRSPILSLNQQTGIQDANIELMYEQYVKNDEIGMLTREAEERGMEKGRAAAQVPSIPFGRRRTIARDKSLPESFDQVSDEMILNDPEIQEAMRKDADGE